MPSAKQGSCEYHVLSLLVWLDKGNEPQVYRLRSGRSNHYAIASHLLLSNIFTHFKGIEPLQSESDKSQRRSGCIFIEKVLILRATMSRTPPPPFLVNYVLPLLQSWSSSLCIWHKKQTCCASWFQNKLVITFYTFLPSTYSYNKPQLDQPFCIALSKFQSDDKSISCVDFQLNYKTVN